MTAADRVRVLVIDDSALMRQLLPALLAEDPAIDVVGTAADPYIAREKIKRLHPDVLTLDVEMPGMDGLKFLENLMRLRPMPVVMVSSVTRAGTATSLRALDLGAVDIVAKPQANLRDTLASIGAELCAKVRAAAQAQLRPLPPLAPWASRSLRECPADIRAGEREAGCRAGGATGMLTGRSINEATRAGEREAGCRAGGATGTLPGRQTNYGDRAAEHGAIVMGASAGGTQALTEILRRLPPTVPGIVVVQHMPPRFTAYFAERLNDHCALDVREARDGDAVAPGTVLIAPGGLHTALRATRSGFAVEVYDGDMVSLHRPSVDVLFESAARSAGAGAAGVILTGMGNDGARGMRLMRSRGAYTLAQSEDSCLVYGMPERAVREGGVCEIVALEHIADRLVQWAGAGVDGGEDATRPGGAH